ncbi:KLHL18 [Bugula neritina]|uniref:KLHL18 n=1 Tax=Bugula neritina TaxID=10212 RepID=A0A7J7KAW6_BUGNE|nr:KLHL18 [Bugula neritina]
MMADEKVVIFENVNLPAQGFAHMEEIRRQGKLCDVTLKVGDEKFTAHRIVLASTIPYFEAMFTHNMVESKRDEICMQGIEASALEALVNFAYTGKVQISDENVQSLLIGANFLNLYEVKESCCEFITTRLSPANVLGARQFGDQLMEPTIVTCCNSYINRHFTDVTGSEEFNNLPKSDVIDIISRDELNISSEEQVFEASLEWVKQSPEERAEFLPDLVAQVRLPLLTPHYLADVVGTEELIKSSLPCRDLLDEAKDFHLMPERRHHMNSSRTRPRLCTEIVEYIVAVGGLTSSGDSVCTVEIFNPLVGKWTKSTPMRTLRSRVGVSVLDGELYAIGGYNGTARLDTVEVFEPSTMEWKAVAPLTCPRSALGAASMDGRLYVCGGFDGMTSLDTVECYTKTSNKWRSLTRMTRPRSAAGIVAFDGKIYALGGHDGLSIFDSVECYNKTTRQWVSVCPMQSRRCRLGAVALNGRLYAAGGYDGQRFLKTCEYYDPLLNKWKSVAPMTVPRSRVALVASCGKLYAIGGYDGQNNLTCVEMYDPALDEWVLAPPMVAHEGGVGVGVIPKAFDCKDAFKSAKSLISQSSFSSLRTKAKYS